MRERDGGTGIGRTFFERLDDRTAAALRSLGRRRDFRDGQVLSRQGQPGGSVLLLDDGLVKVTVSSSGGKEVLLGLYGAGEILGEVSALQGGERSATITGHGPGALTEISATRFREFVVSRPDLLSAVLAPAAQRLRKADMDRLSYVGTDVGGRVASTLLCWADRYGLTSREGVVLGVRASRRELAQAVAASEKTVDDVLTVLSRAGLIKTGRRRFVLVDPAGLSRWVHDRAPSGS
jgi:CRP/FNR family transcriptional regulator, cyclic AMP receptor protein